MVMPKSTSPVSASPFCNTDTDTRADFGLREFGHSCLATLRVDAAGATDAVRNNRVGLEFAEADVAEMDFDAGAGMDL